jgi:phage shock protein C
MTNDRKLYKTKDGATFGGVCKGISEVYNVDVSIVRLLTVLITILVTGLPLIVYLVMYLVIPDKSEIIQNTDEYKFKDDDYIY